MTTDPAGGDVLPNTYSTPPPSARWTHVALRVNDIDATIVWYTTHTPLTLLARREDEDGYGAWLGHDDSVESPFLLVVAQFLEARQYQEVGSFNLKGITDEQTLYRYLSDD